MNNLLPYNTLRIALMHDDRPNTPETLLSFDEIRTIAKAAVSMGIDRFEITGGEPLEREDIPVLLMMLSSLTVLKDMTLTTSGILLPRWAKSIRGAGVRRVTVKLDTFDPVKYRILTGGGDLTAVLAGIRALMEVGFPPATLQVRLIGGVNDDEIASLVRLTKMTGVSLRLMELTDEESNALSAQAKLSCEDAFRRAEGLKPVEDMPGTYRLPGASGTVTLVPCENRMSGCLLLSADGMINADDHRLNLRGLDETDAANALKTLFSA